MNSTGSQWISSNLSLTGFTLSQAAFMTCKELIENALDATSSCSQPSVGLHIESGAECLEISCSDNGSGFGVDSIESLHTVFQSTPAVGGDVRTGKFGIGLKAIAMMSHSACRGRDVVITSVRAGSDACIQFSLGCGESNEVVIKEVTLAHSPDHSPGVTSRVTVFSPHPSDFDAFLTSVGQYMSELILMRKGLKCTLAVNDEDPEIFASSDTPIPRSIQHQDPCGFVKCTISLTTDPDRIRDARVIKIVRFVNGVPLITPKSATCCLLLGAVTAVLKQTPSMGIELAGTLPSPASVVDSVLMVASPPQGSKWTDLYVRINLTQSSSDVDYSCLSKDGVEGIKSSSGSLTTIVTRCVRSALRQVQSKFPSQFQSNEDFERKNAINKYIPCISKNLAECLARLSCDDAVGRLATITGTGDTGVSMEERLKNALTDALGGPRRRS